MYVSPEVLRKLDELARSDLQHLRDTYFGWLLLTTAIVAVGVILEGPEVVHESHSVFRKKSDKLVPSWITVLALAGWTLVAIGVAGEGVAEALVSRADSALQTFNDILLSDAERTASQANEQATENEKDAALARSDAQSAKALAKRYEAQIADSNARAKEAEARAAEARSMAEASRLEAEQLKTRLAWRTVSEEQMVTICHGIPKSLAGLKIGIDDLASDPEGQMYAEDIAKALRKCGLVIDDDGPRTEVLLTSRGPGPVGVLMHVPSKDTMGAALIQEALKRAGIDAPGELQPNLAPGSIRLLVGPKPRPK